MILEDIIEALNKQLEGKTLVLHHKFTLHPRYKVYKVFTYDLYKIESDNKELCFTWSITKNVPNEDLIKAWPDTDKEYLVELMKWVSGPFNELKKC